MDYNTQRKQLILREYGRNIQNLVEFIKNTEDREKRSEYAHTAVDLMKQIAPDTTDNQEGDQKFWDDLHIISGFELDVDSEFEKPDPEVVNKRPKPMPYSNHRIKYKHYGKNIELLIEEALKKEDPQEREEAVIYIGKLMKSFYGTWNKEMIDDKTILDNINTISGGKLDLNLEQVQEDNLFERLYKSKKKPSNHRGGHRGGNRKSNQRRRRKN